MMGVGQVRRLDGLAPDRHHAVQELDDGGAEYVIAVAGDHVAGTGDVDEFAVRAQLEEITRAFLAEQVR